MAMTNVRLNMWIIELPVVKKVVLACRNDNAAQIRNTIGWFLLLFSASSMEYKAPTKYSDTH